MIKAPHCQYLFALFCNKKQLFGHIYIKLTKFATLKSYHMHMKASYHTLGCKLNFAETATIAGMLLKKGIYKAGDGEKPDICIVNTCSVTETADKKARSLIRRLAASNPQAAIIVTGCYAQLKPYEISELPGVRLVLGTNEKLLLPEYIEKWLKDKESSVTTSSTITRDRFMPSCEKGDRTRYFLKVQDGCDYFCTYCTIPYARGRSRSGRIADLIDLARDVAKKGGKEIVITGVNIGTFGNDTGEDFLSLLKALDDIRELDRFRISSIEPNLLTDSILKWIATESRAFMPHFHIPLQSGSDKVLRLMNRRYDTSLFKSRIDMIHSLIKDAYIGVDIIVGARGETDQEWMKSLEFASSLDVAKFHVFPYSERPGTKALLLGDVVAPAERRRRAEKLISLSDSKNIDFIKRNIGKQRPVLWEKSYCGNLMHGLTDNYIRVEAPLNKNMINRISAVILESVKEKSSDTAIASHI